MRSPTASAEIAELLYEWLLRRLHAAVAYAPTEDVADVAADVLVQYLANPDRYRPERGKGLAGFLLMDTRGDLLNLLASKRKRQPPTRLSDARPRSHAPRIKLSGSDDTSFRSWLSKIRTQELGGHGRWSSLTATHADSANNWGTFAGASRIAASLYLGDTTDVAAAAKVVRGFMGDRAAWDKFRKPGAAGELEWACSSDASSFTPINPACSRSGINLDGAIVTDIHRDGEGLTWPVGPTGIKYTHESLQGLTLQTELLHRNGYSGAWTWSNSALRRAAGLVTRNGQAGGPGWNPGSVQYHVPWLLNFRYGLGLPTTAAGHGRTFGYTDWLYGGH